MQKNSVKISESTSKSQLFKARKLLQHNYHTMNTRLLMETNKTDNQYSKTDIERPEQLQPASSAWERLSVQLDTQASPARKKECFLGHSILVIAASILERSFPSGDSSIF